MSNHDYGGYTTGYDPHWPEYKAWLISHGWPQVTGDEIVDRLGYVWHPSKKCPDGCWVCKDKETP